MADGRDRVGIDVGGMQVLRGAEKGVHGALAVRRHHHVAARGRRAVGGRRRVEGDAGGADVVGEGAAELVVLDLADEGRARAEARDADDGVGGRAAGNLHRRAHRVVDRLARAARRSAPCRPCASSAATRKSSSARAITSTMALPMPRTSYLRSGMKILALDEGARTIAAQLRAATDGEPGTQARESPRA